MCNKITVRYQHRCKFAIQINISNIFHSFVFYNIFTVNHVYKFISKFIYVINNNNLYMWFVMCNSYY